jgi:hypothetical protein
MSLREGELSRAARPSPRKPTETKRQREQRLKKARVKQRQLRQRLVEDDDAVLSFKEWCALNGHSERQGRRILTSGKGPMSAYAAGGEEAVKMTGGQAATPLLQHLKQAPMPIIKERARVGVVSDTKK